MASFSNEFLQRLKDSVNILDVIGSYVELTKKGRYYFVLFMVLRRPLLFLFLPKRDFITALAVMPAGT